MKTLNRRVLLLFFMVIAVLLFGTGGYMLLEGWNAIDAIYMTIITLSTVGFAEVHPLSNTGQLFTIILIVLGVSILAYGLRTMAEYFLEQNYVDQWRQRRIMQQIQELNGHYIICGLGRVGLSAAKGLQDSKRTFVVIDKDLDPAILPSHADMFVIDGDATDDAVLLRAGVAQASTLIVTAGDDSINLFIVLSARALNPDLFIITRSISPGNEEKMKLAGADRVISPYRIGGKHMANIAVRPHVTDFFEITTLDNGVEIWVEELVLHENSVLLGKTVGEIDVRRRFGVTLVALRHYLPAEDDKPERVSTVIPDADSCLQAGDELIVLGTREGLTQLEAVACRG